MAQRLMKIVQCAVFLSVTNAFSILSLLPSRRTLQVAELHVSFVTRPSISSAMLSNSTTSVVRDHEDQKDAHLLLSAHLERQRLTDSFNRRIKAAAALTKNASQGRNSNKNKDRTRAAEKAERLLREMMNEPHNLPPNPLAYTNTIVAWSRSRDRKAPHRAQALLEEMKVKCRLGATAIAASSKNGTASCSNDFGQLSKVPYTAVITAWSRSRDRNASTNALKLLQEMKDSKTSFCSPNAITYGACISAVSGVKALELLQELESLYEAGDESCRPDTIVYSSTIVALAKMQGNYHRVMDLLNYMESESDKGLSKYLTPNSFSYSAAIGACWDRFRPQESLERACAIVQHLEQRYQFGLCTMEVLNVVVYNSLLDICSRCESKEAAAKALSIFRSMPCSPDCTTYCTVITAVSRSGDSHCGHIAMKLVEEMTNPDDIPTSTGDSSHRCRHTIIQPNTHVYGAAIAAQAKCGDSETAQRLFDDMIQANCTLNTICYNSLISANLRDPNRAYQLLRDMYQRYDGGEYSVKPNTVTFNTVLGVMASSLPPVTVVFAAQELLEEMRSRTAAGELGVRPDHVTYSTLIGMWTDSNLGFEASEQVEILLKEMERLRF